VTRILLLTYFFLCKQTLLWPAALRDSVTRFLASGFFMNHLPTSPWSGLVRLASQGAPPVSTTQANNCHRCQRYQWQSLPAVLLIPGATTTGINCGGSKCSNGGCLRSQWRRGGSKWSRGGSVDQWSQIDKEQDQDPHQRAQSDPDPY
jgi:hypothetical protein